MGDAIAFNARYVLTGANDIKVSGESMKTAFEVLKGPGHPTSYLESQNPAGNDETGDEFKKWYPKAKTELIDMGLDVGDYVIEFGKNVSVSLASFIKTDLEAADDLKIQDL